MRLSRPGGATGPAGSARPGGAPWLTGALRLAGLVLAATGVAGVVGMAAGVSPAMAMGTTGATGVVAGTADATDVTGAVGVAGAVSPVSWEGLSGDLVLTTVHDGPFEAGGTGVFSVDVTAGRLSPGITRPTGVTYHFPEGLTPVRARGTGWTCRITDRRLGCGTTGRAGPGFQLPRITVEVAVAPDASGTLTATGRAVQSGPPPGTGLTPASGAFSGTLSGGAFGGPAVAVSAGPAGTVSGTVACSVQVLPAGTS
ncbi:hypothetical protein [Streptosporangium longisporum]|uniref:Uncharacterized protein n=1 Tax=Streptosporangium longisporum TaxID=46187 RepID=A0ABP6KKH0_9ACTN